MSNQDRIVTILKAVSQNDDVPAVDESLFEGGYLDSFALPDMVTELEREFSIQVPDADLHPRKFESIARIQSYIESRL